MTEPTTWFQRHDSTNDIMLATVFQRQNRHQYYNDVIWTTGIHSQYFNDKTNDSSLKTRSQHIKDRLSYSAFQRQYSNEGFPTTGFQSQDFNDRTNDMISTRCFQRHDLNTKSQLQDFNNSVVTTASKVGIWTTEAATIYANDWFSTTGFQSRCLNDMI